VDHLCAIFCHLVSGVFNIPARAAIAGGIPHQFQGCIRVDAKGTYFLFHRPDALSPGAASISVTDDDANLFGTAHKCSSNTSVCDQNSNRTP
jgi:hypothetical protein